MVCLTWFWGNCPRKKLPPTLKLTLTQTLTLTGGQFFSWEIARKPSRTSQLGAAKEEVGCDFNIMTATTKWIYAILKVMSKLVII